jgi:hypothetical protein
MLVLANKAFSKNASGEAMSVRPHLDLQTTAGGKIRRFVDQALDEIKDEFMEDLNVIVT